MVCYGNRRFFRFFYGIVFLWFLCGYFVNRVDLVGVLDFRLFFFYCYLLDSFGNCDGFLFFCVLGI